MDYELFHNDIDGSNYHFVLIEASVLQKYFDDYHQTSELNHLKGHCKSDPKQDWICFGKNLHGFIVPSIKINEEGDVTITDGRHRVLWMMSKKNAIDSCGDDTSDKNKFRGKRYSVKRCYYL